MLLQLLFIQPCLASYLVLIPLCLCAPSALVCAGQAACEMPVSSAARSCNRLSAPCAVSAVFCSVVRWLTIRWVMTAFQRVRGQTLTSEVCCRQQQPSANSTDGQQHEVGEAGVQQAEASWQCCGQLGAAQLASQPGGNSGCCPHCPAACWHFGAHWLSHHTHWYVFFYRDTFLQSSFLFSATHVHCCSLGLKRLLTLPCPYLTLGLVYHCLTLPHSPGLCTYHAGYVCLTPFLNKTVCTSHDQPEPLMFLYVPHRSTCKDANVFVMTQTIVSRRWP